jgi:hypothetical protein
VRPPFPTACFISNPCLCVAGGPVRCETTSIAFRFDVPPPMLRWSSKQKKKRAQAARSVVSFHSVQNQASLRDVANFGLSVPSFVATAVGLLLLSA